MASLCGEALDDPLAEGLSARVSHDRLAGERCFRNKSLTRKYLSAPCYASLEFVSKTQFFETKENIMHKLAKKTTIYLSNKNHS